MEAAAKAEAPGPLHPVLEGAWDWEMEMQEMFAEGQQGKQEKT